MKTLSKITLSMAIAGASTGAFAASIYIFDCTNAALNQATADAFTAMGHNAVIGQPVTTFTNLSVVSQYEAVYVPANHNWGFNWNAAQQQTMIDYVNSGGGLITAEWVLWMQGTGSYFQTMGAIMPSTATTSYDSAGTITYTQGTANAIMNNGMPTSFTTNTSSIAGVRTLVATAKAGATTFYGDGTYKAVVGWNYGNGRVINFHTVNGTEQLANTNFRRLLGNSLEWVTSNPPTGPGVTGRLSLQGLAGTMPVNASFYYVNATNNVGSGRVVGNLDANGNFTIAGPNVPGQYRLYARTGTWLRKVANVTTAALTTYNVGTINLLGGDCNNDNLIDIADYSIIAAAFDAVQGGPAWDVRADVNRDLIVDIADYALMASNFDAVGN